MIINQKNHKRTGASKGGKSYDVLVRDSDHCQPSNSRAVPM